MPAQSKQQQKFMGMVHALKKGEMEPSDASPELKKAAQSMSDKDAKDFASTPHKGLPKKVKQEILNKLKEYAGKMNRDHMGGDSIPSANKGGLRDFDGYDNVDYNKDMPMDESMMSTLDQIKKTAKNPADFIRKVFSDNDFKDMKGDRDFIKYLHSIYEGVSEGNIPTNWLQGRTSDYHTKKGTTPREDYEDTNFDKEDSGQPDLEEKIISPKQSNPNYLASAILNAYDFATEYIDDGGQKRKAEKYNDDILDWFDSHPSDIKQKAFKIMISKQPSFKSKIQRLFGDLLKESVNEGCWKGYKQVGGKMKNGRMVPNCVPESINESDDTNSLKKIHDAVFKFLKTKKGVGEVKEFSEFPNRYGNNVSTFSVKYNVEDKYNYDLQEIKIEYSTSRVFIPNKGYFSFKTFNDIKNIINKKSSLKESVNENAVDKLRTAVQKINQKYQVKVSTHPATKGEIEIILGRGNHSDSVYNSIEKLVSKLGIKRGEYSIFDESVNEAGLKGTENIPSNKKLSQLSDNEKLNILQSGGNIISFHIPDWAKGRYKFWQVISAGKVKKGKSLSGETQYFLQGKGPQKASPTYKSVKDLINGVDWDTMELRRESVNEASFHALNNPRMKKSLNNLVKDKKVQNPETGKDVALQTALSNNDHPAHDRAVSIKQSLLQRLKGMMKNEYGSVATDNFLLPSQEDKLDGTPKPKKAIGESLDFNEREMVVGIIDILKQVDDKENRKKIALNMIKKFKEEGIEFDYQKFLNHLKEYSMGSYEYNEDKTTQISEAMFVMMRDIAQDILPKDVFQRAVSPQGREELESIMSDLKNTLNKFFKMHKINKIVK